MFGSTTIDLTNKVEDPTSLANGFDPIRHRIGIAYEDNCLQFGVTWKRDYEQIGDARKGNTFSIQLALKNLGMGCASKRGKRRCRARKASVWPRCGPSRQTHLEYCPAAEA